MKKLFIIFLLFITHCLPAIFLEGSLIIGYAQSGWVLQSPLPTMAFLYAVQFPDRNTGYACGEGGQIIKTTDSGVSWTVYRTADTNNFMWISFVNVNTGYVSGFSGLNTSCIFKTTNGGVNWTRKYLQRYIGAIFFTDANTGYCADSSSVLKTIDGGDNWFAEYLLPNTDIGSIFFLNSMYGFAGGANHGVSTIFKTSDGGTHWVGTDLNANYPIISISFVDSLNGYLANTGNSYDCYIFRTTDGGNSWAQTQLPNYDAATKSISFINISTGYLIAGQPSLGPGRSILKTTDAGLNWNVDFHSCYPGLLGICAVESQYAFAVGYYGRIAKTSNQGLNWNYVGSEGPYTVNSLYFFNQLSGIAVGDGIAQTTNGGINWVPVVIDTYLENVYLKSVVFINSSTGFAMGGYSQGIIVKTTDGGATWNNQTIPSGYSSFYSMYFINETSGFLIAEPEHYPTTDLLKTTNGGNDWNPVHLYSDSSGAATICFTDQNTGFIAGWYYDSSEVYKSTNGGNNWLRMHLNMGIYPVMVSMSFPTSNIGYITGDGNKILKTTNAGVNWTLKTLNNVNGINTIWFANAQTGYGAGSGTGGAEIIKTTDGGDNWVLQNCGYPSSQYGLNTMFFVNDTTGWVAGNVATIYKTTTGGNPIGIKQVSQNVPQSFVLYQNYPNPFNPSTVIKFQVSSYKFVTLTIYDILGRKVATLVNENLKPGQYETDWNASNYASGVYFYQLIVIGEQSTIYSQTKKLVLLK